MIPRPIIIITIILLMISSVSAATNIAFDPLPTTPAVPATFNYTVFTTGLTNTSFVLSNVTFARTDLVISNCFKNNTNINGVSFSIINLTPSLSSLQVNATNTSELFTSGITKESLFDIQFYYYNASYGNNDSVIFDASTTQWYGNATTDDAGFNAFTTMDDGWINATIANSYNTQEIVMAPQFALTVHITDSTKGLPLPVVATVTDTTNTISNTTTSGTTTLFESYGIVTGTIVAEGYNSRAFSVVVDSNMEVTYQLTPTTTISPNINTVYTQHFVSFRIVDMYQKPIQLADINASYIASSLPTGGESSSFLQQAFGVSESVALDMQNGSIAMSGQTTTDGTQTFVMFPALTYKLMVQNDTQGVACQKTISPSDTA